MSYGDSYDYSALDYPYNVSDYYLVSTNGTDHLYGLAHVVNLYLIPIIANLGIVGNLCAFLVFLFSPFRYFPCSMYLAALVISDTGFLAALLLSWMISLKPEITQTPGCCHIMVYVTYVCSFLSAWYVVLMMLERYIVVCYPLRAPRIWTKLKARIALCSITFIAIVMYLHSFVTTGSIETPYGHICTSLPSHLRFVAIFTYVDSVITFVVPFIAILFFNLRIIYTIHNFRRKHHLIQSTYNSNRHQVIGVLSQAQIRSTKMIVLVSSVFLLLYLPSYAMRIYILIKILVQDDQPFSDVYHRPTHIAQLTCQFLYYINFAIDFLVYSLSSRNFRRNVTRLVRNVFKRQSM
ncbi:thyrotropin-releasing hormone receptor-like [Patella vulgata]|uniref:thyrotropin-releasing hormone receptor-like n=1 Tax=Patella vulgata TaxID=6465 RepID=UPI00217FE8BA|nr:thyrotropin-releasing hormone receptor-like [Patella vulgata]